MATSWKLLRLIGCFSILLSFSKIYAQSTVGVLAQAEDATDGYKLIFPHNQEKVFLLDKNGKLVHYWDDEEGFVPGNSVYILPNGNLIKCKRLNKKDDPIFAGGAGATVEIRSWENDLLHSFTLNNDTARLHHDVAPLPNGNILMIAWENFTGEQALKAGRKPEALSRDELWSEMVIEWNPVKDSIVWSWHVWDHLIQDEFPDKDNYGNVEEYPGKIDINYDEHDGHPDWLHINSIAYNPVLDQIALSVPYFNELWVIDHSTTPEESRSDEGGRAGKGGQLLFRYGNDKTYLEQANEQILFFQHDVEWVKPEANIGDDDFGKMALFNNRLPDTTSIGMVINTLEANSNDYINPANEPQSLIEKKIVHPTNSALSYSTGLSSIQVLENGHVLLLAGRTGYAYELDAEGNIVWEYRIPIKAGKPVPQGTNLEINNNITFRMDKYPLDYQGFVGRELSPMGLLEEMEFDEVITDLPKPAISTNIEIYPNPTTEKLQIESNDRIGQINIFNAGGQLLRNLSFDENTAEISLKLFKPGLYFLTLKNGRFKVIKQ